ncbi:unnamed protein product [Clonostachys rhizophaga]|uniref:Uncharacterized protein n=1 Tax=Clonostachys rhizophaga TaxID=160324 RepID=A0A9N9VWG2_9HYPO|nr:unnamed protein product [Clonostachys rhizophaga]
MCITPYLSTLAPEILELIIEHTHASGHWPLAQTCKYIYLNSLPILDRHRKACQEYRICSDLDPWTISKLLWSVFSDGAASIEAWHVREFEVWVERNEYKSWGVNADTGERILHEDVKPRSLSRHEIDSFCATMPKLPHFYGEHRDLNQLFREPFEGGDSFVKAVVLAYLPRIQALRYAQFDDERRNESLTTLCGFIYWCKSAGTWLPGLNSLERVAVAIGLDRAGVEANPPEYLRRFADEFCALLCLPNLAEIYFSHLDGGLPLQEKSRLFPKDIQIPSLAKTSSVKTIILDRLEYELSDKLIDFVTSIPRRLENLAIRFRDNNYCEEDYPEIAERLIHQLAKHQGSSLQRLCIHDDRQDEKPADMNWRTPGQLKSFKDLRVANVSWKAIETSLDLTKDDIQSRSRSELLDRLFEVFRHGLPATMEVITFGQFEFEKNDPVFLQAWEKSSDSDLEYLDDAVEIMITSRHYKNLKAVFLQDIQKQMPSFFGRSLCFPKTMKAAESRGIRVYTRGSKPLPGLSTNGEFVPFPRRDCMLTGQFESETRERLYCTKKRREF